MERGRGTELVEDPTSLHVLAPAGMSRRRLMALLAAASGTALLPGRPRAQSTSLNLFTYPTYANEALVSAGRARGLDVKATIYSGADEMIAKLRGGGVNLYDMVVPLHTYVRVAAQTGLIEPMEKSKLKNLPQVTSEFQNIPDWSFNGRFYGVPFVWGANAMAFNFKETGPVDSLKILWDPKYQGRVAMRDDVEDAIAVGALYLGIDRPFELNENELAEVKKVLIEQKKNLRTYWRNIADLRTMFVNGEVVAAWATLSVVAPVRKGGVDVRWVWPKEGALGWTEGIAAVKGTRQKDAVEAYADFTISPEYGETLARETRYATTSGEALKHLPPELVEELGIQPERMGTLKFKLLPANKARWSEIWTEVKAS